MAEASLNVTDAPDGSAPTEVDSCVWESRQQHEVLPTALCSICLSVGLLYCFLGKCSWYIIGTAVAQEVHDKLKHRYGSWRRKVCGVW